MINNNNNNNNNNDHLLLTPQQQSMRELEHPFLKVPYESLNKAFRASQKSMEKDLSVIEKAVKEMNKKANKSKVSQDDACKYLDKVVSKLVGVKRKLEETDVEQERHLNICRARMEHLDPTTVVTNTTAKRSLLHHTDRLSDADDGGSSDYKDGEKDDEKDGGEHDEMKETAKKNVESWIKSARVTNSETEWNKIRLNRVLVDYFLRNGYYESANQLANTNQIQDLVDIDVFLQSRKAIDGLKAKNCTEALNWCSEHRSKLKKLNNTFEFELRLQEFIELVRADKRQQAIAYARKYFKREESTASKTSESESILTRKQEDEEWTKRSKQIQQAMALLAFGKGTTLSPYRDFFSDDRWQFLIQSFQHSYYELFSLTKQPLLYLNLQAGLSALKNPLVYHPEHYNVHDPMCHKLFQEVAENLPFSFHVHSKLVCRITGKLMDDRNPPMVLPNGNVYSLEAMEQMALRGNGTIEDPRTNEQYPFSALKKSFVV